MHSRNPVAVLMSSLGAALICLGVGITVWPAALAAFGASLFAAAVDVQTPPPKKLSSLTTYFVYDFMAGISAFIALQISGHVSHFIQPGAIVAAICIASGVFLWVRLSQWTPSSIVRDTKE